jgi:hypothetical protein
MLILNRISPGNLHPETGLGRRPYHRKHFGVRVTPAGAPLLMHILITGYPVAYQLSGFDTNFMIPDF